MAQAKPLHHLSFLSSYDEDGRAAYVRAIVRVLDADEAFERDRPDVPGWRTTQGSGGDVAGPAVRLKAGYVRKLVNEGVLEKVDSDDEYARYRLAVPGEELVAEVRAAAEHLDAEHRTLFKDLPYW